MDQYYSGENNTIQRGAVRSILDSVVAELVDNPNRTFTWVEQVGWSVHHVHLSQRALLSVFECVVVVPAFLFCITDSGLFVSEIVTSLAQILQLCCAHECDIVHSREVGSLGTLDTSRCGGQHTQDDTSHDHDTQAFFQMWWLEQNDEKRAVMQKLVAAGQFVFVNGGWCMHDEAATHYIAMIDQTTLGHRYLLEQFGPDRGVPTVAWQLDPFGHSATRE